MTITLDVLVKSTTVELNKMKKEEIISALSTFGFQYTSALAAKKEAENKLKVTGAEELSAKKMLLAYSGYQTSEDQKDYNGEILWEKVSLSELIGLVMLKAARY